MIYCPKLISWQSMKHAHSMLTLPINLMIWRRLVNRLGYILPNNMVLILWKLAIVEWVKPICCNWNFCSILITNAKESDVSKNDPNDCFFLMLRAATVEFKQVRQPYHRHCFNIAATTMFYVARSRQDSCLGCLTPHGGPDTDYVMKVQRVLASCYFWDLQKIRISQKWHSQNFYFMYTVTK